MKWQVEFIWRIYIAFWWPLWPFRPSVTWECFRELLTNSPRGQEEIMNCLKRYNLEVEGGRVRWKWKRGGNVEGVGGDGRPAMPSPHTNVSVDITWDLRLPLNRFSSFQTYTCKMKRKGRQIWAPHRATKGPATPLPPVVDSGRGVTKVLGGERPAVGGVDNFMTVFATGSDFEGACTLEISRKWTTSSWHSPAKHSAGAFEGQRSTPKRNASRRIQMDEKLRGPGPRTFGVRVSATGWRGKAGKEGGGTGDGAEPGEESSSGVKNSSGSYARSFREFADLEFWVRSPMQRWTRDLDSIVP